VVVGAGTLGSEIGGLLAARGYRVSLYSRSETTLAAARTVVEGLAGADAAVDYTSSLQTCLVGADIVSENAPEDLALKRDLFAAIEQQVSEDCLLTSNTSSVPIGAMAGAMRRPDRLVGMHWFNPPSVMPLIEIVRGPLTADQVVADAKALAVAIGKETIEVRQDIPGFVVNRLQYALLREALYLVEAGVASIEDIDRAVETTLGPRWSASGPLRLMDLAGLDTVEKVCAVLMPALSRSVAVPLLIEQLVAGGALGAKSGRGFYAWTAQTAATAKALRDETVRWVSQRRKPAS
jgi:3-hydroxybutyryl-CoA dehydrogenase